VKKEESKQNILVRVFRKMLSRQTSDFYSTLMCIILFSEKFGFSRLQIFCCWARERCKHQWRIQTRRSGGSQIGGGRKGLHLLYYQRLFATIVVCHTHEVIFVGRKVANFCWSTYVIFQRITTVWKCFVSLIHKSFETGPNQWASIFTSYIVLVYLHNVFEKYKSMLRASVCHSFGYL